MAYIIIVIVFLLLTAAHFLSVGEIQVIVDFVLILIICTAIISSRIWGTRKS